MCDNKLHLKIDLYQENALFFAKIPVCIIMEMKNIYLCIVFGKRRLKRVLVLKTLRKVVGISEKGIKDCLTGDRILWPCFVGIQRPFL